MRSAEPSSHRDENVFCSSQTQNIGQIFPSAGFTVVVEIVVVRYSVCKDSWMGGSLDFGIEYDEF